MTDNEKLVKLLHDYFTIGDSYAYNLTRDKAAFDVGTMSLEDFEEFDIDTVADLADHLLANGVTIREPGEWKIITDDYGNEMMECSRCGSDFYDGDNDTVDCLHNFCPNCGAPMKGETK